MILLRDHQTIIVQSYLSDRCVVIKLTVMCMMRRFCKDHVQHHFLQIIVETKLQMSLGTDNALLCEVCHVIIHNRNLWVLFK